LVRAHRGEALAHASVAKERNSTAAENEVGDRPEGVSPACARVEVRRVRRRGKGCEIGVAARAG